MNPTRSYSAAAAVLLALVSGCSSEQKVAAGGLKDHSLLFNEPFKDGPSVTSACLRCHDQQAHDFMKTVHWQWLGDEVQVPGHERAVRIGKKNLMNNFCTSVTSNWQACTTCHNGYGWKDEHFDFSDASRVDCLICHDRTGNYSKKPNTGGLPDNSVDLLASARSVGKPTRANCGRCHFNGGGGNGVKHGDLDNSLLFPDPTVDFHMGAKGMQCIECHKAKGHVISGRSMTVSVEKQHGVTCQDCHKQPKPHADERLNAHLAKVACQACHIPFMAVEEPTKMSWDWSKAGDESRAHEDSHRYLKIKGEFTYQQHVAPEYRWYDGTSTRYLVGDTIDPEKVTVMSGPRGSRAENGAKIWPFKVHRGRQVYDKKNRTFMVANLWETDGSHGYWQAFDWQTALRNGSRAVGLPYSGEFGFAPTEMYLPQNHMVARKEEALNCRDCHGEAGRLDWKALGYAGDPMATGGARSLMATSASAAPNAAAPACGLAQGSGRLLDARGRPVQESGGPLSTRTTCGACHKLDDAKLQAKHPYHRGLDGQKVDPRRQPLLGQFGSVMGTDDRPETNCLACHLRHNSAPKVLQAYGSGEAEWAAAAALEGTGLVARTGDRWVWNRAAFSSPVKLPIAKATPAGCGTCHGLTDSYAGPVSLNDLDALGRTADTGLAFSGQRISASMLNIEGKDQMRQAWDVHAQRLVACADCHYNAKVPFQLAGQRLDPASGGSTRRCSTCHDPLRNHAWLESKAKGFFTKHFTTLTCTSCHVQRVNMVAKQMEDRTVVDLRGAPRTRWRGTDEEKIGNLTRIVGYKPMLLVGAEGLGPFNLVAEWFWVDGKAPIPSSDVAQAMFENGAYRPEILAAFDADKDGALSAKELRLDSAAKVRVMSDNLRALGHADPAVKGTVTAHPINHGVTTGQQARQACADCHRRRSSQVELAPYVPAGVIPEFATPGGRVAQSEGRLILELPGSAADRVAEGTADRVAEITPKE